MAIFSKKSEDTVGLAEAPKEQVMSVYNDAAFGKAADILIQPRLSEKAVHLNALNKYVFKVKINANKLEIKKAVEKFYGVKVLSVNTVKVEGKRRRYGKFSGKMSDYKKAIVSLKRDSKKPEIMKGV